MTTKAAKREPRHEFHHETVYNKFYRAFVGVESLLRHPLLLLIRLYWGVLLIAAGVGKFAAMGATSDAFAQVGIPLPSFFAFVVAFFEVLGGVSFVLGFLTRFFSLIVAVILFFAYYLAHYENLTGVFMNPPSFIAGPPFLYLYAALVLLCFGAGAFSLDYWLEKKMYGHSL